MPFKESARVIYRSNPLVEVICQFKFPPVLRIGTGDIAGFQDIIRAEYPLYETKEPTFELVNFPKELSELFGKLPFPKSTGITTHRFLTKDKSQVISLSQEFLAVADTNYRQWESFKQKIEKSEAALTQEFKPAFYSRIGLRYRDLIVPEKLHLKDKGWSDLLQSHIAGELADKDVTDNISEIRTRTVIQLPKVPGAHVTLVHGLVRKPGKPDGYLIDADFSLEKEEGIDGTLIILDEFNRLAGRLFRWTISDTLHKAMEPQSIKGN